MRLDRNDVTRGGGHALSGAGDRIGTGKSSRPGRRGRSPDREPAVTFVPGDEPARAGLPVNLVGSVGDAGFLGEPDREQIGFYLELEAELSRAIGLIAELVLHHYAGLSVGSELKPLDVQAVQHFSVLEAV